MRRFFFTSLLAVYTSLLGSISMALSYSGTWDSQNNGHAIALPVQADLRHDQQQLKGSIVVDNYRYELQSHLQGSSFRGLLTDQSGAQVPVQAQLHADRSINLRIYVQGAFAEPQTLQLRPDGNQTQPQERQPQAHQSQAQQSLDYQLIGRWVYSESYTSGEYAFGSQDWVELSSNGEVHSASQSFGGGPDSNVISGAQPELVGRWRVQQNTNGDRLLSLQESGQWYVYGRYYIEHGRMLITRPNGEKEFWRQHQ
ncbi:hypothetical protein [Pseudoteredinibacter isoporae]|uniref:hypothetical protein n=1 Tax=Pseudoteredinibacter isoporae TaxID=570281 RepID=UPI003109B030